MGLLSGLGKLGKGNAKKAAPTPAAVEKEPEKVEEKAPEVYNEADYLMPKSHKCPVCDKAFKSIATRNSKLRRLEPDMDLRPRYKGVDVVKYDAVLCPNCGYAAMESSFDMVSTNQIRRLKDQVMNKFKPLKDEPKSTYTYDEAIMHYKMCEVSAVVKNARASEQAYLALKMAWLYKEMYDHFEENGGTDPAKKDGYIEAYEEYYRKAYDGFIKAVAGENPPFCGINQSTMDYLLAGMAVHFNDDSVAARYVSQLLTSSTVSSKIKDKALELKEILQERRESREADLTNE